MWGKLLSFCWYERVVISETMLLQSSFKCQIKSMKYVKFTFYKIIFLQINIYRLVLNNRCTNFAIDY